jgi:hypothetical protein
MTPAYIPVELRRQVRADVGRRCGNCHIPEALISMPLEYEHLYPNEFIVMTGRFWVEAGWWPPAEDLRG